jgi:hypothetical protein
MDEGEKIIFVKTLSRYVTVTGIISKYVFSSKEGSSQKKCHIPLKKRYMTLFLFPQQTDLSKQSNKLHQHKNVSGFIIKRFHGK